MSDPIDEAIHQAATGYAYKDGWNAAIEECARSIAQLEHLHQGMFGAEYNRALADAIVAIRGLNRDNSGIPRGIDAMKKAIQLAGQFIRNEAIEECARELEAYHRRNMYWGEDNGWFIDAVTAIRTLKDKP